jgi:hypothetical protein
MTEFEVELQALRRDVDRLKSKDQILQQLTRYGRGQEWLDATLMDEVFFDDAFVDFGFFTGVWRDYKPVLMEIERNAETTFHLCAAPQVEFAGDDKAYVECYGVAGGRSNGLTEVFGGRYFHTFERRSGEWKSARCAYVLDWHLDQQTKGPVGGSHPQIKMVEDRSPRHPLYRRMGLDVT